MADSASQPDSQSVNDEFAVMGQLRPEQIAALAEAGFKAVICNRPDGEAPEEPQFSAIEAAAQSAGLAVRYIPVSNQTGILPENIEHTRVALAELDGPILAYCRSGGRSTKLYEFATSG